MRRYGLSFMGMLLLASSLLAFDAVGTFKKADIEKGVVFVYANNQDRTVRVAKDIKVLDTQGKELPDGLKSKELKEGAVATFTVEREDGEQVMKVIRLGKPLGKPPIASKGKPSVGLKPLTEMTADDKYQGEDGGLYGGGKNEPPAAHQAAAQKEVAKITPLDKDGKPSAEGTIALVSISMSNATQEFSYFKRIADSDPEKSPRVTIVDCAQGGQAMAQWVDPKARAWTEADRRIAAANISPKQVQIAWIKLANVTPSGDLQQHGKKLQKDTVAVLQNAKARFPNLRIAFLGSRIYGGYASGPLNPEPYAYEGAFAARWLIQDQIKGAEELNYDSSRGTERAPLLLWGPYFWADGMMPRRSDGLVWERDDMVGDGVHPSDSGRKKVANQLLTFFKTDPNAKSWFVKGAK
jgi:hypothetical protein